MTTWSARSATTFVWGKLTPTLDAGTDIDFAYVASEQRPLLVSAETARAIQALTNLITSP